MVLATPQRPSAIVTATSIARITRMIINMVSGVDMDCSSDEPPLPISTLEQ